MESVSMLRAESQDEWELCRANSFEGSTEFGSELCLLDDEQDYLGETFPQAAEPVLFIFDWDDTLMPTHWLTKQGLMHEEAVFTEAQRSQLQALADRVAQTLEAAAQQGKVVIITNAAEGWVQQSCLHFLPDVMPILQKLRIVSARSTFEPLGIRSATEWKVRSFEREVELAFSDTRWRPHVVSVGDSQHEHEALLQATRGLQDCYSKSLKFMEQPSIDQLLEEHALVAGTLEEVLQFDGDLDVDVGDAV